MVRTIVLMRHAKSSWDEVGLTDRERPLNARGLRDAPRMAKWFSQQPFPHLDWLLSSSATRTVQTAEIFREHYGKPLPWQSLAALYHATPQEIVQQLRTLPDELQHVLLIGHNPGLEELVAIWSGRDRAFPTAAMAGFSLAEGESWETLASSLNSPSHLTELFFQMPKSLP